MDSVACLAPDERAALFRETAAALGFASPVIPEKDFWVCFLLRRIFGLGFRPVPMFKGGTSLSKAFGLIDRFSEDIDLTLSRADLGFVDEEDPLSIAGTKKRKRRIEDLGDACAAAVRDRLVPELRASIEAVLGAAGWQLHVDAAEDGQANIRFAYPRGLAAEDYGGIGYIASEVLVEVGARSDQEPAGTATIQPYASEHFPDMFSDALTEVWVLAPERTFWEKATILHAESHRRIGATDPAPRAWTRISRHAYDLAMLTRHGVAERAIARMDLLRAVARHKNAFYYSAWANYDEAVPGTLRVSPPEPLRSALVRDYRAMQPMLFGDPPSIDEVLDVLTRLEETVNRLD